MRCVPVNTVYGNKTGGDEIAHRINSNQVFRMQDDVINVHSHQSYHQKKNGC